MKAEPMEIRALARRIREQGEATRLDGDELARQRHTLGWTGVAGATMVVRSAAEGRALALIVEQHELAARALEVHADAVEASIALIAEIERRVHPVLDAARSRVRSFLADLVDAVDPTDEVLAHFTPPAPGSPEWLDVRLPGVTLPERRP